ncbi:MAG: hypothetical protein ACYDH9_26745 [Limisphaerales bacterium]
MYNTVVCATVHRSPACGLRPYATAQSTAPRGLLKSAIIGVFFLSFSTGCSHLTTNFYPIGIYSDAGAAGLPAIRQAGFNAVSGPAELSYLDAALTNGLKVLAYPGTSAGPNFDALAARRTVKAYDSHRALWAWYLVDEPDLNRIPPEIAVRANRFLKSIPAHKPTALVIYNGVNAVDYADITDVMMVDRYPIPWLALASFPQHVRLTRLAAGKKKPLIAVIQAFDWSYSPELVPGETHLRPPTYAELRCMTYCALAQGANGLFYFTYDDDRWRMREHPETWNALKSIVAEVNARRPLFQAGRMWWSWSIDYPNPADRFNEALEGAISLTMLRVPPNRSGVGPGYYVLGVNTTGKKVRFRFRTPVSLGGAVPVLGEDRSLPAPDGWLADEFPAYAVHVYGPLPLR